MCAHRRRWRTRRGLHERRARAVHVWHAPARAPCADNSIGDDGARAVGDGVGRLAALTSLTLDLYGACVWEEAGGAGAAGTRVRGAGTRGGAGGGA